MYIYHGTALWTYAEKISAIVVVNRKFYPKDGILCCTFIRQSTIAYTDHHEVRIGQPIGD